MTRVAAIAISLALLSMLSSCRPSPPAAAKQPDIEAIRERALASFASGIMIKPDRADSDQSEFALAPIFILEEAPESHTPATVEQSTVTVVREGIVLDGVDRTQVTFLWPALDGEDAGQPAAGMLRMTLDSDSAPVIWEASALRGDLLLIFVARSLEEAAAAEFGAPLPGRRYAIECGDMDETAVVVRVIEDGPQPMGPFVYLDAANRNVTSVICRCMPSQVNDIAQTGYYRISPLVDTPPTARGAEDADWLSRVLRLPKAF